MMNSAGEPGKKQDVTPSGRFELGSDGPSLLVVGIDGSPTSWRALYYAFGLARRQCSVVVAVYAFTPVVSFVGIPTATWHAEEDLAAELRDMVHALSVEHGVVADFVCTQRDPVLALTQVAADRRADAIIVGASKGLAHRFFGLGSTAVRTVRRSRCPVTVVP